MIMIINMIIAAVLLSLSLYIYIYIYIYVYTHVRVRAGPNPLRSSVVSSTGAHGFAIEAIESRSEKTAKIVQDDLDRVKSGKRGWKSQGEGTSRPEASSVCRWCRDAILVQHRRVAGQRLLYTKKINFADTATVRCVARALGAPLNPKP